MRERYRQLAMGGGQDDQRLQVVRRDFSGGMNNRNHPSRIAENQAVELKNVDISVLNEISKRPGSVQYQQDLGDNSIEALHSYIRQGYNDNLLAFEGTSVWASDGENSFTEIEDELTTSTDVSMLNVKMSGVTPDDVVLLQTITNNCQMLHKSSTATWTITDLGDTNTSPPLSTVGTWYGNRAWYLKDDLLFFSGAYPSDYAVAFDRSTNSFRIPVGKEMFAAPTRDLGIIVGGEQAIWALAPSVTPDPSTDKPQPILTDRGCVSKNAWALIGDDIYFFSQDGLRALKRTVQDKVQLGADYAISYVLKDDFENISWSHISKLCMKYFDNKLFISIPTGASTFEIWVYSPATNAFTKIDTWQARCWAIHKTTGEDRLYYGKQGDGVVYRAWYGYTDEGTTISDGDGFNMTVSGREEDMGQPLIRKLGGEIEIESAAAGNNYTLTIYVAVDGANFVELDTVELTSSDSPTLPVSLPFFLADAYIVRKKIPLDSLGAWRTLQVKIENTDTNTEPITVYGYNLVTFPEEYENE